MKRKPDFPLLPLETWKDTKVTLHLFSQIVGKVRLSLSPRINHWWHVPLYVSARGLTTSSIPYGNGNFDMELDLIDHALLIRTSDDERRSIPLASPNISTFYKDTRSALEELGIEAGILGKPFDPERVHSTEPFATDTKQRTYDPVYANRFWRILVQVDAILKEFRGRFLGKCSPVHFFWHSFDLAVTRFSGRRAPAQDGADLVTREAYSHEVVSAGFWPGDDNVREPAFYTYVHPEPEGLAEEPLRPAGAFWSPGNGSAMALFRYEDFRKAPSPRQALLDFLQSAYEAGARLAHWPREDLETS